MIRCGLKLEVDGLEFSSFEWYLSVYRFDVIFVIFVIFYIIPIFIRESIVTTYAVLVWKNFGFI